MSRKFQTSIVFFTGRHFPLPVPYRQPIHMAVGPAIPVTRVSSPSPADVQTLLDQVVRAVTELYETKKPQWEHRPLVVL